MRVLVNGVRLFFEVVGTRLAVDGPRMRKKPTVVLLHGGPGFDHTSFRPQWEPLAEFAQLVMVDLRGNGRSDDGDRDAWTLAQWGDDVRGLCDALEIDRPIVFGGSWGGMVAISYATRHVGHAERLVLSSTTAQGSRHFMDEAIAMFTRLGGDELGVLARRFFTGPTDGPFFQEWAQKAFPHYTQKATHLVDPDAAARRVVRLEVASHFTDGEWHTFDMLDDLRRIECPTLVIAGELDPICPVGCADRIAQHVRPDLLTFRRYAECGHQALNEVPEALDELREFICAPLDAPQPSAAGR